jgi:mannose-6-phosphate isomerase-like protein (cupin superfamily)
MKKVALTDVKPYEAAGHFGMVALKLHGKEETGSKNFWMGFSHFLPNGGAEMAASPAEKIYFVTEGAVTVKTETEEIIIEKHDSVYIPENEARYIVNHTNMPASMLVICNYPD